MIFLKGWKSIRYLQMKPWKGSGLGLKTAFPVCSKGDGNQLVWPQEQCPPCFFLLVAKVFIRQDGTCCCGIYTYPLQFLATSSASLTNLPWSPPGTEDKLQPWLWSSPPLCQPALDANPVRAVVQQCKGRNVTWGSRGESGLHTDNRHLHIAWNSDLNTYFLPDL